MKQSAFTFEPVVAGVHVITDSGSCTIGVCVQDDRAVVIDSGHFPRVAAAIRNEIGQKLGCTAEFLFNTHYHSDHTFGNQSFDCPIIASRQCLEMMNECLTSHWSEDQIARAKDEEPELADAWRDLVITPPTTTFDDELTYDFHGRKLVFRRLGGHSPDSSVLYMPDDKLMFTGDIVFAGRYPTLLAHDGDPERLIDVLGELLLYDVDSYIPGHGPVCGKETLRESITYWRCLLSACGEARREGLSGEDMPAKLMDDCRLEGIAFDNFRHRRNIISVLHYLSQKDTM